MFSLQMTVCKYHIKYIDNHFHSALVTPTLTHMHAPVTTYHILGCRSTLHELAKHRLKTGYTFRYSIYYT